MTLNSFNRKAKSKKNQKQGKKLKLMFLPALPAPSSLSSLSILVSFTLLFSYKYQQLINQHHHQPFDSVQFLFLPVVRLLNWILSLKIKDNYVVAAFFLFFSRRRGGVLVLVLDGQMIDRLLPGVFACRAVGERSFSIIILTNKSE